ncbi:MAG: hypothetical protein U0800_01965 [Isosphaeraceae bacterium]
MLDSDIELYEDPVALLQAEVERLEAELRAREEVAAEPEVRGPDEHSVREIERLRDELSLRDETIAQLWDHLRNLEESEAASQAEWEQVQAMIDELEARLTGQPWTIPIDSARVEEPSRQLAWDAERDRLTGEIDRLRGQLDRAQQTAVAAPPPARQDAEIEELRGENARLRADRQRWEAMETEAQLLRIRLKTAEDSLSHTAPVSATPVAVPSALGQPGEGLSPDERIRALRLHLREVHQKEAEERKSAQLAGRLSRLWHSLGRGS